MTTPSDCMSQGIENHTTDRQPVELGGYESGQARLVF